MARPAKARTPTKRPPRILDGVSKRKYEDDAKAWDSAWPEQYWFTPGFDPDERHEGVVPEIWIRLDYDELVDAIKLFEKKRSKSRPYTILLRNLKKMLAQAERPPSAKMKVA